MALPVSSRQCRGVKGRRRFRFPVPGNTGRDSDNVLGTILLQQKSKACRSEHSRFQEEEDDVSARERYS